MATIRSELASAYLLTASRVGAWACVSAMVMRTAGPDHFGELSLWRSSVVLLTLVGAGFMPVILRQLLSERVETDRREAAEQGPDTETDRQAGSTVLRYEVPRSKGTGFQSSVLAASLGSVSAVVVGLGLLVFTLAPTTNAIAAHWSEQRMALAFMVVGMMVRVMGEVLSAALQSRGRLQSDNVAMALSEWSWPAMLWLAAEVSGGRCTAYSAAGAFFVSGLAGYFCRLGLTHAAGLRPMPTWRLDKSLISVVVPSGLLVVSSLADFLYGSTNVILLGKFGQEISVYAPALQVDGGLLLLASAVSSVAMPRVMEAFGKGDLQRARQLYWRGTLAATCLLTVPAMGVAVFAGPVLRAWLGNGVWAMSPVVLRLVLIHTVVGGSSGIGRAVLLAAGRYRVFALVAVGFGLANAAGVWWVLSQTNWGVRGVVGVTIVTVALRCGVWMPWYVGKVLGEVQSAEC